jgi:hypothetical protein
VLGAVGTGWPAILAAAPGSGWTAALAAALDADAATALGAMHTSWPAVLAAAIDADAATMLGAMGTGWPAYLAVAASVLRHQQVEEGTNITGIVSTTPAAGSPVCGMTFVAPPSGVVTIGVGGDIDQTQNTFVSILGWELRTGGTIGSGTIIQGANANYAFMLGGAVTTGGSPEGNATALRVITGLVAGDTYNVRTMHWVNGAGGTMNVYNRLLTVLPSP